MIKNTADTIANIQDRIYNRYGVDSAPAGALYISMVCDMAKEIVLIYEPAALNDRTLTELTENNAHMARHAAEIVRQLARPARY